MSKYVIHKLPVDISDAKREEYIRYMKTIANQHSNTYFVSISKYGQYLISDTTKAAEPILLFKTIRLTEREFIKSISWYVLQISYLKNMIEERKQEIYRYMIGHIILSNCDIDKYEVII